MIEDEARALPVCVPHFPIGLKERLDRLTGTTLSLLR
jgi:hypothetical protein